MTDVDPKGPTLEGVSETQLQRVVAALPSAAELENIRANHRVLRDVLSDVQDRPPEGAADRWTQLRSIERRLSALLEATDEYVLDGGALRRY